MSSISIVSFALWLTLAVYAFSLPTGSEPPKAPEPLSTDEQHDSQEQFDAEWLKESLCVEKLYCKLIGVDQEVIGSGNLPADNFVLPGELSKYKPTKQVVSAKGSYLDETLAICSAAFVKCPLSDAELSAAYDWEI